MILTGLVITKYNNDNHNCDCQSQPTSRVILYKNVVYVLQRQRCTKTITSQHSQTPRYQPASLSSFVQYYFLDVATNNIYRLDQIVEGQVQRSVWRLTKHLCLLDDDGRYLYNIVDGKIVSKEKLVTQVVTRLTTTDLNSSAIQLLLLADFDSIRLTDQSQIGVQSDPNNTMAAIVDNTAFGITTSVAYKFYPNDDPSCPMDKGWLSATYNCIEVTNLLEKSAVTLPYSQTGTITFGSATRLATPDNRGLMTTVTNIVGDLVNGSGNWQFNLFKYTVAVDGNYQIAFSSPMLQLDDRGANTVFGYVRSPVGQRNFANVDTTNTTISYDRSLIIDNIVADSVLQFGIYNAVKTNLTGYTLYTTPTFYFFTITITRL